MKTNIFFIAIMLLAGACSKQFIPEATVADPFNGYRKFLKAGEQVHTLWAGKHINIGTVTYGIDDQANFYATYDCSLSGWTITETHLFAGDMASMPLNKPGKPKIGLFPHTGTHQPGVSSYTYLVPLSQLPPCASPGFVVAAHCVVHSPNGQQETAWAEGAYKFSDKGWGWYDDYFYDPPALMSVILYGTANRNDSLLFYHIDVTTGDAVLILTEFVGQKSGQYDGAAYDMQSGTVIFTNYDTKELWINHLDSEGPSYCAGILSDTAASGTFHDGNYYYIGQTSNTIHVVSFSDNWIIEMDTILDTIPGLLTVSDIAMSPEGDYLHILGNCGGQPAELAAWNVGSQQFYTLSISLDAASQIAYGSDGALYAVEPYETGNLAVYSINTTNGVLTEINEGTIIIIDSPFTDLAGGPGF